jgi:hypothetical protein
MPEMIAGTSLTLKSHACNVMDGGRGPPIGETEMIGRETVWKIYNRVNFQDHGTDGIAEGLEDVARHDMADLLSVVDDLDAVSRAVEREREIRLGMARTGEGREVVAESLDSLESMDQEAVLELTDGEPTTLVDALTRYIAELQWRGTTDALDSAASLAAILEFPWSHEEELVQLHEPHHGLGIYFTEEEDRDLVVRMGNNRHEVYRVNWEDAGSGGQRECQAVAEAVYRATLVRVIPDRNHHVQLSSAETTDLIQWLARVPRSGSAWISNRLTVDACGGGVIVRTRTQADQGAARRAQNQAVDQA